MRHYSPIPPCTEGEVRILRLCRYNIQAASCNLGFRQVGLSDRAGMLKQNAGKEVSQQVGLY